MAFARVPLSGLKEIGASRPLHATVNDVLLAVVAGGLRTWLGSLDEHESRGTGDSEQGGGDGAPHPGGSGGGAPHPNGGSGVPHPGGSGGGAPHRSGGSGVPHPGGSPGSNARLLRGLRAQVPVSLHHRGEQASAAGNRDSFINVDLALDEPDPLRRLDLISARTRTEKQLDDAEVLYDLFHALGRLGAVGELAQRFAGGGREFGVAISNVPGPRYPVAVAGRRVGQLYSSSEPATHHALRIAAISDDDEMGIGFCTDPTALPGVDRLAEAVAEAYDAIRAAALGAPA